MRRLISAVFGLCLAAGAARADDYDEVRAALDAGDYNTAYATLAEMGNAGDTLAMIMLSNLQLSDVTGPTDYGLGIRWLEQAAEQGNVHAMLRLGAIYFRVGQYLFPERTQMPMAAGYPEAIDWFGRAADTGSTVALTRLGALYRLGLVSQIDTSLSQDDELALSQDYLERAAAGGSAEATGLLASTFRRDDPDRYVQLLLQAGGMGDPRTLGILAVKPEEAGITDPVEALAWKIAARNAWEMDPNPRSPVIMMLGADSGAQFAASMTQEIDAATPEDRAAAEVRAAEISAGWTSLLPGHAEADDANDGGGLFGRN